MPIGKKLRQIGSALRKWPANTPKRKRLRQISKETKELRHKIEMAEMEINQLRFNEGVRDLSVGSRRQKWDASMAEQRAILQDASGRLRALERERASILQNY